VRYKGVFAGDNITYRTFFYSPKLQELCCMVTIPEHDTSKRKKVYLRIKDLRKRSGVDAVEVSSLPSDPDKLDLMNIPLDYSDVQD
jgi:hypothetical protein